MKKYDVVTLGAGPGGYISAIRAAQLGAKTAIIEKEYIGGTCLNVGCIPTKFLTKNVEILNGIEQGKKRGIRTGEVEIDFAKTINAKNKSVKQLRKGIESLFNFNGVDVYHAYGSIGPENKAILRDQDGGETFIKYEKLIIATGANPVIPAIEGFNCEGVITNRELLELEKIPKHLVIIGGGVIGCEFADAFKAFGSEVTIVEKRPMLMADLDADISNFMEENLKRKGIQIKLRKYVRRVEKYDSNYYKVHIHDENNEDEIIRSDKILVSIGRMPNLNGLQGLNLELDGNYIRINEKLETSCNGVYAIGDVTGKKQLAHVASKMGINAAENACGLERMMEYDLIPSCIYTIPEIGSIGLTEKEAIAKGEAISIGRFPLMANSRAVVSGEVDGFYKVVANKETQKLLGAHLIGQNSTEIIHEIAAFLRMGATVADIYNTIHAHPTISEALVDASLDTKSMCVHLPR